MAKQKTTKRVPKLSAKELFKVKKGAMSYIKRNLGDVIRKLSNQ